MSQSNVLVRERATLLLEEPAFGDPTSTTFPNALTRFFPLGDELIVGELATEMLDVMDERVQRDDNPLKVHGLQIASKIGALKWYLKAVPTASQLDASGALGSLPDRICYRHGFGTEYAAVGSVSASSASTTSVSVTTGEGTLFRKGTIVLVENAAHEMEWAKITAISTDTLTVSPALSGIPADGAIVRNLYNYTRAESNTRSMTVRQAFVGDSAAQITASGCYGSIAFDAVEFGKLPTASLALTATSYDVTAQSISVAPAADAMGASAKYAPQVYLATSITRGTTLVCESASVEMVESIEMVRDPAATQTVNSVVRVGGRPTAVKLNLKLRFDSAYDTAFAADTTYRAVIVQKIGSGTSATFYVWEVPAAVLVGQPKRVKVGERLHLELALEGRVDTSVTDAGETGAAGDAIRSTFRFAFG